MTTTQILDRLEVKFRKLHDHEAHGLLTELRSNQERQSDSELRYVARIEALQAQSMADAQLIINLSAAESKRIAAAEAWRNRPWWQCWRFTPNPVLNIDMQMKSETQIQTEKQISISDSICNSIRKGKPKLES